jgi:hypothetical protein
VSIDPLKLAQQRGELRVVRTNASGGELYCKRCGVETHSKHGICRACKNGYGMPDPKTLSTARLADHIEACKAELKRRRDEIDAAMERP